MKINKTEKKYIYIKYLYLTELSQLQLFISSVVIYRDASSLSEKNKEAII